MSRIARSILLKPYNILGLLCLLLGFISFLNFEPSFNIQLGDSYHIFSESFIIRIIAILLFILWVLYKLTIKLPISNVFNWIHVVGTLICSLLIVTFPRWAPPGQWSLNRTIGWFPDNGLQLYGHKIIPIVLVLIIFQLIFVINLIRMRFKKMERKNLFNK
jgi:hypothetical protein